MVLHRRLGCFSSYLATRCYQFLRCRLFPQRVPSTKYQVPDWGSQGAGTMEDVSAVWQLHHLSAERDGCVKFRRNRHQQCYKLDDLHGAGCWHLPCNSGSHCKANPFCVCICMCMCICLCMCVYIYAHTHILYLFSQVAGICGEAENSIKQSMHSSWSRSVRTGTASSAKQDHASASSQT